MDKRENMKMDLKKIYSWHMTQNLIQFFYKINGDLFYPDKSNNLQIQIMRLVKVHTSKQRFMLY